MRKKEVKIEHLLNFSLVSFFSIASLIGGLGDSWAASFIGLPICSHNAGIAGAVHPAVL